MIDERILKLLGDSHRDNHDIYVRSIEIHSIEDILKEYKVKDIMGMHGMIPAYVHSDGSRYRKSYWDDIIKLGKVNCVIEESSKGIRISTLDLKYQIPFALVKNISMVRFDDFDYHEGYSSLIGINELDGNDIAANEMKAMGVFEDMINSIKDKHNGIFTEDCQFEMMQSILKKYNEWCLIGHREYPILTLVYIEHLKLDCQISVAMLTYVNNIGNGGLLSYNHFFTDGIKIAKRLGLAEGKSEKHLDITLSNILNNCSFIKDKS